VTVDPVSESYPVTRGPLEERSLFNAAFIAVLLYRAVRAWKRERNDGMHMVLSFLIVPLALHIPSRTNLPRTKKASMLEWVQGNPDILMEVSINVVALREKVLRGLELGTRTGVLVSLGSGNIDTGRLKRKTKETIFTDDVEDCFRAAEFLGKWFAQQNDYATILAMWGVRP